MKKFRIFTLLFISVFSFIGKPVMADNYNVKIRKHKFRNTIYVSSEERSDDSKRFDWICDKSGLPNDIGNSFFNIVTKEPKLITLNDQVFNKIKKLSAISRDIWGFFNTMDEEEAREIGKYSDKDEMKNKCDEKIAKILLPLLM